MQELAKIGLRYYDRAGRIVLDGNRFVPGFKEVDPEIKADATFPAVSAASILAKCHQCGWMNDFHLEYPQYGFDRHRGYGTVEHLRALRTHGPCPIHRKSVKPVRKLLSLCGSG